jgi:hypothetical protein
VAQRWFICLVWGWLLGLAGGGLAPLSAAEPIRLHPDNPHYFQYDGRTTILVTSAEHYGAVLNADFDWQTYLETLAADKLNYTRLFSGAYIEQPGDFGINRNTLAPAAGKLISPWVQRDGRYDLTAWNPAYFERLHAFLTFAQKRGIIVEMTFFSSSYKAQQWSINPFHEANNHQGLPALDFKQLHTLENGGRLPHQEALVRKLVRELNKYPNLFFEIQNEPWSDQHTMGALKNIYLPKQATFPNAYEVTTPASIAWQRQVGKWVDDEEQTLPQKHLLAQNIANFRQAVGPDDIVQEADILNFHYAYPEAVTWNRGWRKLIGYDESGFAGTADATYRAQAWNFLMAGGGLFNNLDYSFSVGHERGTDQQPTSPGGGSAALRKELGILKTFLESFPLEQMHPDHHTVTFAPGMVTKCLSAPGKQYAIYVEGSGAMELTLALPPGNYKTEFLNPQTGERQTLQSQVGGEPTTISVAKIDGALAVSITAVNAQP